MPRFALAEVENDDFYSVFKQERSAWGDGGLRQNVAVCDVLGLRMLKMMFLTVF